jgi:hypothetical protein
MENSPEGAMEFDLTPVPMGGDQYPTSSPTQPQYDDEDRNEIINLIRSLESSPVPPESSPDVSFSQPLTPASDTLFDDRDITRYYVEDFDAMFNF